LAALLCHGNAQTAYIQHLLHHFEPSTGKGIHEAQQPGEAIVSEALQALRRDQLRNQAHVQNLLADKEALQDLCQELMRSGSACANPGEHSVLSHASEDALHGFRRRPHGERPPIRGSSDLMRLVQDPPRELQGVKHESEQLKTTLMATVRPSTHDCLTTSDYNPTNTGALRQLQMLRTELERGHGELEHMKMLNALQAAKHNEAWQRANVKREAQRRSWLRKLDALSLRLVHRRRIHKIFQNWSVRCRARKAGHELVYERKVHCCMLDSPCIQCEHLLLVHETVASSQPATEEVSAQPDEKSEARNSDLKPTVLPRQEDQWNECNASFDSSFFSECCSQEPSGRYVCQTVKQLATLIYEQAPSAIQGSHHGLDCTRHEAGVLGAIFDADGVVIEIVPHSPAHVCGWIGIGDRLLSVSRQHTTQNHAQAHVMCQTAMSVNVIQPRRERRLIAAVERLSHLLSYVCEYVQACMRRTNLDLTGARRDRLMGAKWLATILLKCSSVSSAQASSSCYKRQ